MASLDRFRETDNSGNAGTRFGRIPVIRQFRRVLVPARLAVGRPGQLCQLPDPYFIGSIGTGLGQMVRRNFPTNSAGAFFSNTIRNRSAQADNNIDQLGLKQTELENRPQS